MHTHTRARVCAHTTPRARVTAPSPPRRRRRAASAQDHNATLQAHVDHLSEQLERERADRTQWARARAELLAQFCDAETELRHAIDDGGDLGGDLGAEPFAGMADSPSPKRGAAARR